MSKTNIFVDNSFFLILFCFVFLFCFVLFFFFRITTHIYENNYVIITFGFYRIEGGKVTNFSNCPSLILLILYAVLTQKINSYVRLILNKHQSTNHSTFKNFPWIELLRSFFQSCGPVHTWIVKGQALHPSIKKLFQFGFFRLNPKGKMIYPSWNYTSIILGLR